MILPEIANYLAALVTIYDILAAEAHRLRRITYRDSDSFDLRDFHHLRLLFATILVATVAPLPAFPPSAVCAA